MNARETAREDAVGNCRIFLCPNRSLTAKGMLALFGAFALIAITLGAGFALVGAWAVAPFAGLELAVVGMVFYLLYRHAGDQERIDIEGRHVRVVRRYGGTETQYEFERYWVRVRLAQGAGWRPSRLEFGSHGRYVEIGATLEEEARQQLAQRLQRLLEPGYRSQE